LSSNLVIYLREGCHLCDAFLDEFLPLAQQSKLAYELIDVDSTPKLQAQFGHRVPLLLADGVVICEYFLDPGKLNEYVQGAKVG